MKVSSNQKVMVALFLAAVAGSAFAAGSDSGSADAWPKDALSDQFKALSDKGDWRGAATLMKEAIATTPGKADYHNLYAYAVRKGQNPDQ